MTKKELLHYHLVAQFVALLAGKYIIKSAKKWEVAVQKERLDLATSADIGAEELIKSRLKKAFPDHAFYAEESGGNIDLDTPTWIIDPIDGTKEFVRDIPIYCTTFCLTYKGDLLVSVVHNPKTGELFSAAKGCGAWKNGKKVHVTHESDTAKMHLYFRLPDYSEGKKITPILRIYEVLAASAYRVRGIANQNIALCWVGMGGYDGYINVVRSDNSWDYAAGSLFLEEAGGELHMIVGKKLDVSKSHRLYIAGNRALTHNLVTLLHKEITALL